MSEEEKKSNNKFLKNLIVALGTISIGAGLVPFIFDHFLNTNTPTVRVENILEKSVAQGVAEEKVLADLLKKNPLVKHNNTVYVAPTTPKTVTKTNITSYAQEAEPTTFKAATYTKIPLPMLQDSDTLVLELMPSHLDQSLFVPFDMIRNMVVFIDNFSRGQIVRNFSPMIEPKEAFSVNQKNGIFTINNDSFRRYDNYANVIDSINVNHVVMLYQQIYPLIDEAYQELGYAENTFTATFLSAITDILDTPVIHYKLHLVSPYTMYEYTDQNLESLPNTQKLMLRMGPRNLQLVQRKLSQIKHKLERL